MTKQQKCQNQSQQHLQHEIQEKVQLNLIQTPKRRLLMKSEPSLASHSGQQKEKESVTNTEAGTQVRDSMETSTGGSTTSPTALSAHTRRRISMRSEPAVTLQEAIDGSCGKAMRIASVEQVELGNLMELSIMSRVLKWARQLNLSGGLSLCKAIGWNMKNRRHMMVARRLRVQTHPTLLLVTIREGEEQEICSATLERLLRVVNDQVEEGNVVVIVLSKESAMWRVECMRTLLHNAQLKYVEVGEAKVVTNSRCIAEQIKNHRVERVVDGWSKSCGGRGDEQTKNWEI